MPSAGRRLIVAWILLIASLSAALHLAQGRTWAPAAQAPQALKATAAPAPAAPHIEDFSLDRHRKLKSRLDGNVIHRYGFDLRTGQILDAVVEQEGVDVVVRLFAPDGRRLLLIDSLNGDSGPEEIFLRAESTGRYHAEVDGSGQKGNYEIWVRSIHAASAADQINARAEVLFYHARERKDTHPSQAIAEFQEAERLWRSVGNKRRRANALERMGTILSDHDKNWSEALGAQTRSLDLYRWVGDRRSEARMLAVVGITRRQLGQMEAAEKAYRQAIEIASKSELPQEKANALLNLGLLLRQEGNNWDALDTLESALPLWQKVQNRDGEVRTLNSIGVIYTIFGQYQNAMDYFQAAMQRIDRAGSAQSYDLRAQVLTRISDVYEKRGDLGLALAYAQRALRFRQKGGNSRGEAVSLSSIGLIAQSMGALDRARDAGEQALSILRRLSDRPGEAAAQVNLGMIILDQKDPRTALEHFAKALELARGQKFKEVEILALYGVAQAERLRGNPINAKAALNKIPDLVEALPQESVDDDSWDNFVKMKRDSYGLLIDLLVKSPSQYTSQEDLARAFEINERSRWQSLLKALAPARRRAGFLQRADPALFAERTKLREDLSRNEEERRRSRRKGTSLHTLEMEQGRLIDKLHAVEAHLRRSDPWAKVSSRSMPISIKEAQNLLDPDTTLLEYRLGTKRSFLWLVTTSSADVFILPPRSTIEDDAHQLNSLISEGESSTRIAQAIPIAKRLTSTLLGPVADRLGTRKLVIVPDGAIYDVPFAALPDPAGTVADWQGGWPCPLMLRHGVVSLPSVSVLEAIRFEVSHRKPPPRALAVLAAPSFASEDLSPLPHSEEEARKILGLVPPEQALAALGFEATRDLAMSGKLSQYRFLHLATHAWSDLNFPEFSSVILSQIDPAGRRRNGYLRFHDIRDLDLPADLVVLSACDTALGKELEGQGPVGLGQAFMYAGAARVVVSLWNVSDESTPLLMDRFYRGILVDGHPPAEALRAAQIWMAKQPRWQSPYYWASFELEGEWR